jgi:K+-transporting ATPase ATPase A chain
MAVLFACGSYVASWSEQAGDPALHVAGILGQRSAKDPGGNMEGKEVRLGVNAPALFSVVSARGLKPRRRRW